MASPDPLTVLYPVDDDGEIKFTPLCFSWDELLCDVYENSGSLDVVTDKNHYAVLVARVGDRVYVLAEGSVEDDA